MDTAVEGPHYKAQLDELECHYKWFKDYRLSPVRVSILHMKLEKSLRETHLQTVKPSTLAFLAYLYTLNSDRQSYDKALECILEAEKLMREDSASVRADLVVKALELHILYNTRGEIRQSHITSLLHRWEHRADDRRVESGVWGTKALALHRMGIPECEEGMRCYYKSVILEPDNGMWYAGKAILMGRLRRDSPRTRTRPSKLEHDAWETALKLDDSNPYYMSGLAFESAEFVRSFKEETSYITWRRRESIALAKRAYEFAGNSPEVYRQCCKLFRWFGLNYDFSECMQKGLNQCESTHTLLHQNAMFHWRERDDKEKAKRILCEAVATETTGEYNFYAHMDLIKLKSITITDYNPVVDFCKLEQRFDHHYSTGDNQRVRIQIQNMKAEYYLRNNDEETGLRLYFDSMEMERHENLFGFVFEQRRFIEPVLMRRYHESNQSLETLTDLAYFYLELKPRTNDHMRKVVYYNSELLKQNPDNSDDYHRNTAVALDKLGRFEEALDKPNLIKNEDKLAKIFNLRAKCLLGLAGETKETNPMVAFSLTSQALRLNCLDAVPKLLELIKLMSTQAEHLFFDEELYLLLADIIGVNRNLNSFTIDKRTKMIDEGKIIRDVLSIVDTGFTHDLRRKRVMMCRINDICYVNDVLRESRFALDRIHRKLGDDNDFALDKKQRERGTFCMFPVAVPDKKSPTTRQKLVSMIRSPKEQHGGWLNILEHRNGRFKPLIENIADIQEEKLELLQFLYKVVNTDKHVKELTLEEYAALGLNGIEAVKKRANEIATLAEQIGAEYLESMQG